MVIPCLAIMVLIKLGPSSQTFIFGLECTVTLGSLSDRAMIVSLEIFLQLNQPDYCRVSRFPTSLTLWELTSLVPFLELLQEICTYCLLWTISQSLWWPKPPGLLIVPPWLTSC